MAKGPVASPPPATQSPAPQHPSVSPNQQCPDVIMTEVDEETPSANNLSLDEYLIMPQNNVHTYTDEVSRLPLSNNKLVEEFAVPWKIEHQQPDFKKLVRYTPEGYSIVGGLISHVTNAHSNNRTWNGNITEKMFFVCQGQIHIQSWARPKIVKNSDGKVSLGNGLPSEDSSGEDLCFTDACLKDLDALLNTLIDKASKLKISDKETVYPLHLKNLQSKFKDIISPRKDDKKEDKEEEEEEEEEKARKKELKASKLATYIRCNPAFLSHSQKSCILWHLRRFEMSRGAAGQQNFRNIINKMKLYANHWQSMVTQKGHLLLVNKLNNPLPFITKKKSNPYDDTSHAFYRFVRDCHTHCMENHKGANVADSEYKFEELESIAEITFESYLSDILFYLLLDGENPIDIDAWLSDLRPALPSIPCPQQNPA